MKNYASFCNPILKPETQDSARRALESRCLNCPDYSHITRDLHITRKLESVAPMVFKFVGVRGGRRETMVR